LTTEDGVFRGVRAEELEEGTEYRTVVESIRVDSSEFAAAENGKKRVGL
jgi:hypothetical protein